MARVSRPFKNTSHLRGNRERSEHRGCVSVEEPRALIVQALTGDDDVERRQTCLLRRSAQVDDAVARNRRGELDDTVGTALRARGIFLAELAENNVPRLTCAARGAFERHDDVAAELQNRTIAELFFRSLDKRFERYRFASKAEWCDRSKVLVARAVVSTRVLHPAHFAPETINVPLGDG